MRHPTVSLIGIRRQFQSQGGNMERQTHYPDYKEAFEYHGSTTVEVTRQRGGRVIWKDWLLFDSVEEASTFYNEVRYA
jgi:hypothetical protein